MTTGYITVAEFRRFSTTQPTEWSDAAVQDMIDRVTETIDLRTGRSWQGSQTVTNEYYDGDDSDLLWLNQCDLGSVTAISIDQAGDNTTYTTVTPSYVNVYSGEGYIVLNRSKAEVNLFKAGTKTVRVSYTYGNSTPTGDIKQLAILMVRNLLHEDAERNNQIEILIQRLKRKCTGLA